MDVLNLEKKNILSSIDNKIQIKHHKEKNKNKTCVYGLFNFISDADIPIFIKIVKKKLGCSGVVCEDEPVQGKPKTLGKIVVFSGNHLEDIKNIIIEKKITDAAHIKL